MANLYATGYRFNDELFPFNEISQPEDYTILRRSKTFVRARGLEEYGLDHRNFTIKGTNLRQSPSGVQGFVNEGTISEINFTSKQNGRPYDFKYVGEIDAAILAKRAYEYENNDDDNLIRFSDFLMGGNDNIYLSQSHWASSGWAGDDTYYFSDGLSGNSHTIGQYNLLKNGLPTTKNADGFDTVNLQSVSEGVRFGGAHGLERIIGSTHDDELYLGAYGIEEVQGTADSEPVYQSGYSIDGGSGNDWIYGTPAGDILFGSKGDDTIYGYYYAYSYTEQDPYRVQGTLNDTINGGSGHDTIYSSSGDDLLDGASGNDIIFVGGGRDAINGGSGRDTLDLSQGPAGATWTVDFPAGTMTETRGSTVTTSTLRGLEIVVGSSSGDTIRGSAAAERLQGGGGADTLAGGRGADTFAYASLSDSPVIGRDRILDFRTAQGDTLDVSLIDARSDLAGDQAFAFIGTAAFSGAGGELRVDYRSNGDAVVTLDADGDRTPDTNILLRGLTADQALTASAFVL